MNPSVARDESPCKKKCAATEAIETRRDQCGGGLLMKELRKKKCAATEAIETKDPLVPIITPLLSKKKCAATEAIETWASEGLRD